MNETPAIDKMGKGADMNLEERLFRLEQDRAIRDLKMRYLRAADAKDPEAMRACFTPDAHIAFEGFTEFHDRDAFIETYRRLGCAEGIFDIHQGGTGIVKIAGIHEATGWWPLYFHNINLAAQTLTQLGIEYEDRYSFRDDRWLIAQSRSRRKSCLVQAVGRDGTCRTIAMGEAPGDFG